MLKLLWVFIFVAVCPNAFGANTVGDKVAKLLPPNQPEVKRTVPGSHPTTITETVTPNINKGNITVAGSFNIGSQGQSLTYAVDPQYQRFVGDRFALGARIVLSSTVVGGTYMTFAPNATYYMWRHEAWAIYAGGSIAYAIANPGRENPDASIRSAFGVSYFFSPQVAFSPGVVMSKNYGPAYSDQGMQLALSGEFGIFF